MIWHLLLAANGSITLTLFILAVAAPVGLMTMFIIYLVDNKFVNLILRYYANSFYKINKINTCVQKTTTHIGLQEVEVDQVLYAYIYIYIYIYMYVLSSGGNIVEEI